MESVASLCHPWFTTTNLSYRFPIFETSATALCGTTGIYIYIILYILYYIYYIIYIILYILYIYIILYILYNINIYIYIYILYNIYIIYIYIYIIYIYISINSRVRDSWQIQHRPRWTWGAHVKDRNSRPARAHPRATWARSPGGCAAFFGFWPHQKMAIWIGTWVKMVG